MSDIWNDALNEAVDSQTLLYAHELAPSMLVKQVGGEKVWRVAGCYMPDGFTISICHLVDNEKDYDWIYAYQHNGKMDDKRWILVDASGCSDFARYQ